MNVSTSKLSRALGMAALGLGLFSSMGCEEAAKQCGFTCETEGFAKGNASITGVAAVDGFFKSAINFSTTATEVSSAIKAEIDGLKADLELTDADISGAGSIGGAVKAKFKAEFNAELVVDATPAKCDVDAQASFEASADCQVKAGCDVMANPGKAMFECKGGCEVEASAMVECGAMVEASCDIQGPEIACEGSCQGTCTAQLDVAAACDGTCEGTCMGTCSGNTASGGNCNGKCDGMCKGTCKVESSASASCSGKCSGTCTKKGPMIDCTGAVQAKCEGSADASVMCEGKCEGDFEPPSAMVDCEASANCNAQAKADASLKVECTPPSIDVRFKIAGSASGKVDAALQAKFDYKVSALKARLTAILALRGKADIIVGAGKDLIASGEGAVDGALKAFADGDVSASAKFKLVECAPAEFKAAASALKGASGELTAQASAAASVSTGLIGG